ncbi:MAG: hypothetical protein AABX50_01690 [Nanoarchaeota archaeon]
MQKRGLFFLLIGLFTINLVSAQFGYGYGSFSLADILDSIDPATITYGLLFFIMFTLIHLALSRLQLFKTTRRTPWGMPETSPNVLASGVISFSVAALIVYYLYRNDYNLESLFYSLGFSGNLIQILFGVAVIIAAIWMIKKFKWPAFFVIFGLLIMAISIFTELIYEKTTAFFIGLVILAIGIYLWNKARLKRWAERNLKAY